jgi:hypothetical protein
VCLARFWHCSRGMRGRRVLRLNVWRGVKTSV